jgi:phosphoglycolate phosphatase-like HAD superfamily hydrolase
VQIALVIFDVDGTLAERYTLDLLPGVEQFFHLLFQAGCPEPPRVALATNQGGVGMRYWMERRRFGKPAQYPTEESVADRLRALVSLLGGGPDLPVYASFRFRDKRGQWAPVPPDRANDPRWSAAWRKPEPGMLVQAMQDAGVSPGKTLFVGDSDDDREAARAAGCAFGEAGAFFHQDWTTCAALERLGQ